MTQSLDESENLADDIDAMDDGPEKKPDGSPFRLCLATRERLPASRMIRFACSPDGDVVPDIAGRLPGRGVWVSCDKEALQGLITAKGGFSRGFKRQVKVSPDLVELVDSLLLQKCISTIGLAKRASALILGFDQVRNELLKRRPGWLLEASDGADDGRRRLLGLAVAQYERVRVATALKSSELGAAVGRDRVIHGLLKTGQFTDVWTKDYRRLYEFRRMVGDEWYPETVGGN